MMTPPVRARISAVLAAGGRGTRFAGPDPSEKAPKQFLQLKGHPIYVWSLAVLLNHPAIESVVVVVPPDMVKAVELESRDSFGLCSLPKAVHVIAGGATRQESVRIGLEFFQGTGDLPEFVLIHDAARPFITAEIVDAVVSEVVATGACTTGVPPADTIKRISDNAVVETLSRESLLLVQTPQAGRLDWLLSAHRRAGEEGLATTDDAALLEYCGHKVSIVGGSAYNLKITRPEDLILCEALAGILLRDRL